MGAKDQSKLFPSEFGTLGPFSRGTEVLCTDFFGSLRLYYISLNYRKKSSLRVCFSQILGALPSFCNGKSLDAFNRRIRKFIVFFVNNPSLFQFAMDLREFIFYGWREEEKTSEEGWE